MNIYNVRINRNLKKKSILMGEIGSEWEWTRERFELTQDFHIGPVHMHAARTVATYTPHSVRQGAIRRYTAGGERESKRFTGAFCAFTIHIGPASSGRPHTERVEANAKTVNTVHDCEPHTHTAVELVCTLESGVHRQRHRLDSNRQNSTQFTSYNFRK